MISVALVSKVQRTWAHTFVSISETNVLNELKPKVMRNRYAADVAIKITALQQ